MGTVNWKHQNETPTKQDDSEIAYKNDSSPASKMMPLAEKLAEAVEGKLLAIIARSDREDQAMAIITYPETGRLLTVMMPLTATTLDDLPDSGDEYDSGYTLFAELEAEVMFKGGADDGAHHLRGALQSFDQQRSMRLAGAWLKDALKAKPAT